MSNRDVGAAARRLAALALLGTLLAGCDQSARSLSLDETQALEACSTFLKAWQEGRTPADLKPDIVGSDYDWAAGQRLVSFEVLPEKKSDGTNLHIPVRLTLQDGAGKESQADAIYTVGTSPVVTVFRK
jgi:hypothetical protein